MTDRIKGKVLSKTPSCQRRLASHFVKNRLEIGPVLGREVEYYLSVGMLEIKDSIDDQDETFLDMALKQYAELHSCPPYKETPLSIIKRDSNGHIVAGLTAQTVWNWLYIDMLWVDGALRGQGIGSALVAAAEKEALKRGCHSSYLWTESFQGPNFYPKLGYERFFVRHDFPVGFTSIGFMKRLAT